MKPYGMLLVVPFRALEISFWLIFGVVEVLQVFGVSWSDHVSRAGVSLHYDPDSYSYSQL